MLRLEEPLQIAIHYLHRRQCFQIGSGAVLETLHFCSPITGKTIWSFHRKLISHCNPIGPKIRPYPSDLGVMYFNYINALVYAEGLSKIIHSDGNRFLY
jgi:hypothetical protein